MRIVTLGTGAGRPSLHRSSSATGLEHGGEVFLFDCGEGTQIQLMRSPLKWSKLSAIFIGHLHGDHVNGLPGLLGTLSMCERQAPLKIFGPKGLKSFIEVLMACKSLWISYPYEIIEIMEPGLLLETENYRVETLPLDHVIECWGFTFREKDRPGYFDSKKASSLDIPEGPLRRELVLGHSITLDDGRTFHSSDFVGPKRKGKVFSYCLDTRPCENAERLADGVDLLVHEATFSHQHGKDAGQWGHSTAIEAAQVALKSGAKKLVLTHLSQRYIDSYALYQEACEVFPQVAVAEDLDEYEV